MDNEEKIKELEEKMLNYKRNYKQPKNILKNTQHHKGSEKVNQKQTNGYY